jgi:uncharacterized protein (TIGR04141 family)
VSAQKISMSIYLLKTTALSNVEKIFESRNPSPLTNGLEGQFISFPSESREPNWFRTVSAHLDTPASYNVRGQSPAGMILLHRAARYFVVTFGHAWQYLELPWLESDFGRRVALGTIPPDKVIEVNSEQVFAKFHAAKERAPRATSYREFGVETDRDLVGAVEGEPADAAFGSVIRGSTSLHAKIELITVGTVLDKALALFSNANYHKQYPDIDNLVAINDDATIATLDQALDDDLKSGVAKKSAVLFAPSFRRGDATSADGFVFGRLLNSPAIAPYLTYAFWEHHLLKTKETPTLALAKSTRVHMIDAAGEAFEKRTVYECLGYEVTSGGRQHIISSGQWYAANTQFINGIDAVLSAIGAPTFTLPAWDGKKNEAEYNVICCKKGSGRLHFDKDIIHYGGKQSKFEFCDFMDPKNKILFFAKIPSRSSDCSHLVEQVSRTVELMFSSDGGFRSKLKKVMLKTYGVTSVKWLDQRPKPGEWQMCLVALGRKKERLPLFAKCSIARLAKTLDRAGHPLMYVAV